LLFLSHPKSIAKRELREFTKTNIKARKTETIEFVLNEESLLIAGSKGKPFEGQYLVQIGALSSPLIVTN